MPFKKLHSDIKEKLAFFEITVPTPFQSKSIPIIKSGANIYCTAPEGSGKTTTLILTTLQKLKCEEVGTAPRAIILVENRDRAFALYEDILKYTRHTSLRVYACDDKFNPSESNNLLTVLGVAIRISTPSNISEVSTSI